MEKSKAGFSEYKQEDSLEAILAMNMGDFAWEHFLSDELLNKINVRIANDPQKLRRQLQELIELYSVEKTLGILGGVDVTPNTPGFSESSQFDAIAETLRDMLQVDQCHIFQKIQASPTLLGEDFLTNVGSSVGHSNSSPLEAVKISTQSKDILIQSYLSGEMTVLHPGDKDRLNWHPIAQLNQQDVHSSLVVPLMEGKKRIGMMVFETFDSIQFSPEVQKLAAAAAKTFVSATRLHRLLKETQAKMAHEAEFYHELISLRADITESIADLGIYQQAFVETLSEAIDARNHFTQGHSRNVAEVSRAIAEAMRLNEKTVDLIYYAGLVSPLGKMAISTETLTQTGQLSPAEVKAMTGQTPAGGAGLSRMYLLSEVLPYLYSSQERWDGSGGPDGLKGRSIPLGSRILSLADGYCSMTGERPYREAPLPHEKAVELIQNESGSQWDPAVVEAFVKI
ncbi:MAG: GAF domain-containing protein, partial [Cyanobacteria bacterium]|nr:GAF domain-containing protein [Cyanobacteriota bacterium]